MLLMIEFKYDLGWLVTKLTFLTEKKIDIVIFKN